MLGALLLVAGLHPSSGSFGSSRRFGGGHSRHWGGRQAGVDARAAGYEAAAPPPGWSQAWAPLARTLVDAPPGERVEVRWPRFVTAEAGNTIGVGEVEERPALAWAANPAAMYTVMLVDAGVRTLLPDTYFHWLVMNIPGGEVSRGTEVFEYVPPFSFELDENNTIITSPAAAHPMVILVFRQEAEVRDILESQRGCSPDLVGARVGGYRDLQERYGLQLVAGNFFLSPWSGAASERMLCRFTKCTRQPFPYNLPGVNDGPECAPSTKVLDFTLRGPKVSRRREYARATSVYSRGSFPDIIKGSAPAISTGRTKEFRSFDGRFNISRAAPESNLATTLEGDMNVEVLEYRDAAAAGRSIDPSEPVVQAALAVAPDLLAASAGIYKVMLVEPVNQDWDFATFLKDGEVADLVIALINEGEEERFLSLRNQLRAKARNNRNVVSWDEFLVREDITEGAGEAFKATPFYTPPTARNAVNMVVYPSKAARARAFQELAAEDPEFFGEYLNTFTCIACTGITTALHPTYYGPFENSVNFI